jgi:serine/threonine-protein kinase
MAAPDVFGIVGTTQAGNFHVERVVAEGGFGVVYRAQHGAFRAPVALKCLKIPEQMTKQQRAVFLEKFREEAELMFRLSAAITEVVRPLHVDVLTLPDGRFVPFLALEWLEGESLDGIITRRREQGQAPLGLHKVVKMLRPVASALARAHRFPGPQGAIAIIHRDLKPENIFVANIGGTESMKILDFGIAKAKRAASQAVGRVTGRTLEEDESASFTPAYGAPEQWSPKTYGETGPWTDVWGLALTMVEALCGTPPLDGDTYVMRRACLDDKRRPTPRAMGADVPVEVERIFEKALAVDPRKRFKDIESFWSELEIAMGLEPSLRTRDARREPGEPAGAPSAKMPPALTDTGAKLARIDLVKVPTDGVSALKLPLDPGAKKDALRAPGAGLKDPPSSARAKAAPEPARVKPAAEEDWSSLGLGEGAPSSAVPSSKKPFSRKHSVGLELPLQTVDDAGLRAPGPSSELEMSLPIQAEPRVPAAQAPIPRAAMEMDLPLRHDAPAPASVRRPSMELEAVLPISETRPEPAGAVSMGPQAAPYPSPPAAGSVSMGPQAAANPAPPPRRPLPSAELEMSLPIGTAAPHEPAPQPPPATRGLGGDDALDFELHAPASSRASATTTGSGPAPQVITAPPPGRLRLQVERPPLQTVGERLVMPVAILLTGLAVGLTDVVYHKITGNPLELGPVRPFWIAAPLALVGVGFLLWRLIGVHEDE